ncbi:saccharopine dehydrogenase family protein [Nocardia sp. NPDC056952]|uniref:saccharopine dehydrogenase family protein n=1 Tax=Nocardia sp. NPDC056952 TaxID=3345979 RepID=UPI00363B2465
MTGRIVLLGATGYTGGLVLNALLARGLSPVLAGRNRDVLAAIAARHGGLDYALADVSDADSLSALLTSGDTLITTVGPFDRLGHAVARAAAASGAHYIDTTGEVSFVHDLHEQLHDLARETGSTLLPAFGYDYVPGILAAMLAAQYAGPTVRSVDIGYFATGPLWRGLSHGTRETMRDGMTLPALQWRNSRLVPTRTASAVRRFAVQGRRRSAFLVSGTEVLFLPHEFPGLDSVRVFNGWFPSLSRSISMVSAVSNLMAKTAPGRALNDVLTRPMVGPAGGPDATERARTRTYVVAQARSETAAPEVHVEGPNCYSLTGELVAWAAQQFATTAPGTAGVVSPVEAFGFDAFRDGCAEVGLQEV